MRKWIVSIVIITLIYHLLEWAVPGADLGLVLIGFCLAGVILWKLGELAHYFVFSHTDNRDYDSRYSFWQQDLSKKRPTRK